MTEARHGHPAEVTATTVTPAPGGGPETKDRFVRFFHWANAALLAAIWVGLDGGDDLHALAGYAVGALVVSRIGWGFTGGRCTRFSHFLPAPGVPLRYLRASPSRTVETGAGHGRNPLRGLMILLLLGLLLLCVLTGWLQTTDRWWGDESMQLLHEYASKSLMIAAGTHVVAVLAIQRLTGRNLLRLITAGR